MRSNVLALCACLLIAACGGGGDDTGQVASISTQPVDARVVEGSPASFAVAAAGSPPLRYQWQSSADGGATFAPIAGATSARHLIAAAALGEDGMRFRVVVANDQGSVTSSVAMLTVTTAVVAPAISVQPADATVVAGATASFHVTASGTAVSYAWQSSSDGLSYASVPGAADAPSLDVAATTLAMNGLRYRVLVGNAAGSVTSNAALLSVTAAPTSPVFTLQPASQSIVAGLGVDFVVAVAGTPLPTLLWRLNGTDLGNGVLGAGQCAGATVAGATTTTLSLSSVPLACSGAVFAAVASNGAGATSSPATLTVSAAPSAPAIALQPSDASVAVGASASFVAAATGVPTPTAQWQQSSDAGATWTAIVGATVATYATPPVAATDNGRRYRVVFSNASGLATSGSAALSVTGAATVMVSAAAGGRVTSDDGRVTLGIPANALDADAAVSISRVADWVAPAALADRFSVVPGTTQAIKTQGGGFVASKRLELAFAATRPGTARARSRAFAAARPQQQAGSPPAQGVVVVCDAAHAVIIILPPPSDSYETGTTVVGCPLPAPGAGGSQTTISLVTWTPASQAQVPVGNVLWQTIAALDVAFVPDTTRSTTRGDTWTASPQASIAISSVNDAEDSGQEKAVVTLVDGNGALVAQQLLPIRMTTIVLDGPGNFYVGIGTSYMLASYAARYALQFSGSCAPDQVLCPPQFVQLWQSTLAGAPASSDGNDLHTSNQSVVGTLFAVDPVSHDLVGLAGNANSSGSLTADEVSRLGFAADGFVVRLDPFGKLVSATPIVSLQPLVYQNQTVERERFEGYTMRLDPSGNVLVGSVACCAAVGQNPYGLSGLTLKKIDRAGTLLWDVTLATPNEIGLVDGNGRVNWVGPAAIAVDQNGDAHVTYYAEPPPLDFTGSHYVVATVSAAGVVGAVGRISTAMEQSGYAPSLHSQYQVFSYIDGVGNLYLPVTLSSPVLEMLALSPALSVLASTPPVAVNGHHHGYQVDANGKLFEQLAAVSSSDGFTSSARYSVTLRKFQF